ncbi:transglycosylase domain-containing protein [Sphingomonas sp.]|uniref:transglycosylase domain-containing protein n=1 Tax=Sphingomonas sp. TaxID=28214 RepID=UPI003AFF988F
MLETPLDPLHHAGELSEPVLPQPPEPPRRRWRPRARHVAGAVLLVAVLLLGWLAATAPLSRSLRPIAPPSVTLVSADGRTIARSGAIVERPVDVAKLPRYVGDAFVAIEDRRFYRHHGIDPQGIARAAWHNLRAGHVREGGSTITQQLAKMVFLSADRTAGRKAREVLIAFWLEAWLTKREILSRYLSDAYFGDNVYGLRAASGHYFGHPPERMTVSEAAMLAGLMKAPSRLAPSTNLAGAKARQAVVVAAMADAGLLDRARAARVRSATLHLAGTRAAPSGTYFADWVLPAARAGDDDGYSERSVATTLDADMQRAAERAIAGAGLGPAQAALVAMRPDGRVLAMVGGRSYAQSPFNRATQALRQPGSTFKLFVYLAAIRAGLTPDDHVEDRPITIDGWTPVNADRRYRGSITLRDAFARSSNVAAVRLARQVGPEAVARAARDLGIRSPLRVDPSIALGTSGVTLLELASAYAAVAAGRYPIAARGLSDPPRGWLDRLWNRPSAMPARQRAMLLDLLSATVTRGTARAARLNVDAYGKTGTTQGGRDALFVGFSGGIVTAVWIGRDDNKPLPGVAGGGVPARIWRRFMTQATGARPYAAPTPVNVDPDAGRVAGFDLDLGNGLLGDLGVGDVSVHVGADGVRLSGTPSHDHDDESDEPQPEDR